MSPRTCLRCHQDLGSWNMQLCRSCLREVGDPQVNVRLLKEITAKAPEWHARAACAGKDPGLFHVEVFSTSRKNPLASHAIRVAKYTCAGCPVRRECLEDELAYEAQNGIQPSIRGGALPSERKSFLGDLETRTAHILEAMQSQARNSGLFKEVA